MVGIVGRTCDRARSDVALAVRTGADAFRPDLNHADPSAPEEFRIARHDSSESAEHYGRMGRQTPGAITRPKGKSFTGPPLARAARSARSYRRLHAGPAKPVARPAQ